MIGNAFRFFAFYPTILLSLSFYASGQAKEAPTLEAILAAATEQREAYVNEFKDLLSQETKVFTIYSRKGEGKKQRTVLSTFIVYQLASSDKGIAEFRSVLSVDGKKLNDSEVRAQEFFENISKAQSAARELDRIEKEGSRYDEGLTLNGLTLFQAPVLAANLRPSFEFKLAGTETIDGVPVAVVSYRQVKENQHISIDPESVLNDDLTAVIYDLDLPDSRASAPRLVGKFWIETDTGRIQKETRTLTVQPPGFPVPVIAAETVLEYQKSPFGILTPKRIEFTQFRTGKRTEDFTKEISVTFVYGNFTKPDVEVKSEVKN